MAALIPTVMNKTYDFGFSVAKITDEIVVHTTHYTQYSSNVFILKKVIVNLFGALDECLTILT